MRIALDCMGGDCGPKETVRGAVLAHRENPFPVALVGNPLEISAELQLLQETSSLLSVMPAQEKIEMDEDPAWAIRRKRNASILVCMDLIKSNNVDAVVSAGNTGAVVTSALLRLGRQPEIDRPALAVVLPTVSGRVVVLDIGANVDVKPFHLAQFAILGSQYAGSLFSISQPRVGLLNIGEEAGKGDPLRRKAHYLLENEPRIHFIGNVEGKDVLKGTADVVVCDGFVGNALLKFAEGAAETIFSFLKQEVEKSFLAKAAMLLVMPSLRGLKKKIDYQQTGGAVLLGVRGAVVIAHGRSKAPAIHSAIQLAHQIVQANNQSKLSAENAEFTQRPPSFSA